ncbi:MULTISPECIES: zinc-dependent metalloprotease family protein [unclassified Saccharicrinis]|uniref:zinc-dependent metalloprotease family protein n=1 Tax=unclassified Saccharicrinis TaxID=2646859 RepID=UPI003D330714
MNVYIKLYSLLKEIFNGSRNLIIMVLIFGSTVSVYSQDENDVIELNLRVHLMRDITITHSSGVCMENWVTSKDVTEIIMPEVNKIWEQANIKWVIESIIEESVVKGDTYEESIAYMATTKRDSEGHSDPVRLKHLYSFMQPQYRTQPDEVDKNLFHIYLFPFVGNTSQGNAMKKYGSHTIVGTWTNKHNRGGIPEKRLLTEDHNAYKRGSLSRTIAHEIGHNLRLRHNVCKVKCLMGGKSRGYLLCEEQIERARAAAKEKIK